MTVVEVIAGKEWMTDWIRAITRTINYSSGSLGLEECEDGGEQSVS